jgi:hypothetical protein
MQTPPAIPTLFLAKIVCVLTGARMVVDWHNLGYSLLALGPLGQQDDADADESISSDTSAAAHAKKNDDERMRGQQQQQQEGAKNKGAKKEKKERLVVRVAKLIEHVCGRLSDRVCARVRVCVRACVLWCVFRDARPLGEDAASENAFRKA